MNNLPISSNKITSFVPVQKSHLISKLTLLTLLTVASFLLSASQARAVVTCSLYVATNGSDSSGTGSSTAPYATLNKAVSVVSAGKTVCVRAGTYSTAKMTISAIGTASSPIIFTKDPATSGAAILDGSNTSVGGGQSLINISGAKFVTFDGFEIKNSSADAIDVNDATNITISNNVIHDIKDHASVMTGSNITFTGNEVYNAALSNLNDSYGSGGWPGTVMTWQKSDGTMSSNVNFTNNYIHDNWGEGIIAIFLDGSLVQGNRLRDDFGVLLYVDRAKNVKVDSNYVVMTTNSHNKSGSRPDGIMMAVEQSSGGTNIPSISNVTISNNLVLGTNYGIGYWQDTGNGSSNNTYSNVHIYYNTVKDTKSTALWIDAVGSSYPAPSSSDLRNNVIYKGANGNSMQLNNSSAWTLSNNDWPDGIPSPDSTTKGSFAADPLFVSPSTSGVYPSIPDGYKLQASSPARGKGINVAITTDYYGLLRPSVSTDLGFAQVGTTLPTTIPTSLPTSVPTAIPTVIASSTPLPSAAPPPPICPGDVNQNGGVDLTDYSLLVKNFLVQSPDPHADFNLDGTVDLSDYSILVKNFLKPCP